MRGLELILASVMLLVLPAVSVAVESPAGSAENAVSAEKAAMVFVEGLIEKEGEIVRAACLKPYGSKQYDDGLNDFVSMVESAASQNPSPPGAPKSIKKVFAARHLSSDGPASYGYAAFGYRDVVFVDIAMLRNDEQETMYRILVVQDSSGAWYVHPLPDIAPLLSTGLWDESPSVVEFEGHKG